MIRIENLTKKYKDFSIENISFQILKDELIAFVGDNGAGKTTTIKAIFDLIKRDGGEIYYNNESLFSNSNLTKIAFFPDSNNIPLELTVLDYMEYIAAVTSLGKKEFYARSENILEMLEFRDAKKKKLKNLSAGMKKRAVMAAILVSKPEFIILDEPTANLDVEAKIEFIELIKKLHEKGVGILITSHIIEELQEVANKLIIIKKGKLVFNEKIDNKNISIKEIYLKFKDDKESKLGGLDKIYE
ncbi:ABC transporter ATP-binding protein [Spiroplasma chinense]|uniref:ABC transporter ATP-binding protein n=1 Tax=Spiroplasma chinense TaxID=216932 RepID=A0A5B9Y4V2_9MOLU|nr:ABC transporter ATP-binding protein [Spiroplasma chinense]QEH61287.1 ABC transporter ATP-binding protein [Spiroplasma chinense]